jgi:hypothetical protein
VSLQNRRQVSRASKTLRISFLPCRGRNRGARSWLAGVIAATMALSLSACDSGHVRTTAREAARQTIRLPAGVVPAARTLPLGEPPQDPGSDAAVAPTVAQLLTAAAQPGKAGLTAILQLMHAAGIVVTDADQSGAVVQKAATPAMGNIDAGEISALQALIAAGDTTSLQGVLNSIAALSRSKPMKVNDLLPALRTGLATAAQSPAITERVWAQIMYDGGAAGQVLAQKSGGAPDGDLLLPPVQAILLLTQLIGEAATRTRLPAQTSFAPVTPPAASAVLLAARTSSQDSQDSQDCTPSSESSKFLTDILKMLYPELADPVVDAILKKIATDEAEETAKAALDLVEVLAPIVQMIVLKANFHVKISTDTNPLVRTQHATYPGNIARLKAYFYFTAPQGRMWNCLALALFLGTGGRSDAAFPAAVPIPDLRYTWYLSDSSTETPLWQQYQAGQPAGAGIVEFQTESGASALPGQTNERGFGTTVIEGRPQLHDLSPPTPVFQVTEHATVTVIAEPGAPNFEHMAQSITQMLIGGAQNAVKVITKPVLAGAGALTSYGTMLAVWNGAFSGSLTLPVADWAELPTSIDLHAQWSGGGTFNMVLIAGCAGTVPEQGLLSAADPQPSGAPACTYTLGSVSASDADFTGPPWYYSGLTADIRTVSGSSYADFMYNFGGAATETQPGGGPFFISASAGALLLLSGARGTTQWVSGTFGFAAAVDGYQDVEVPMTVTFNYS